MKIRLFFIAPWMLLGGLLGCQSGPANAPNAPQEGTQVKPVLVQLQQVQAQEALLPVQVSGVVASQEEMRLAFKTGGVIQSIPVEVGDRIRKGQVLARLDLSEISAQVSQAQSALDKAQRDLARAQRLYQDTVITLEQVQDLSTAQELASAKLRIAHFNQKKSTLVSPLDGRVMAQLAERGEVTAPGNPVLVVAAEKGAQVVKTGITDIDIVKVRPQDRAAVRFDAYPGQTFEARVSQIAGNASPLTGTYEVELLLQGPVPALKNGFIAKVDLFPSGQGQALRIPVSALVSATPESAVVYVPNAEGTHAQRKELRGYRIEGAYLLIPPQEAAGLQSVITEGAKYLRPGTPIQLSPTHSMAAH